MDESDGTLDLAAAKTGKTNGGREQVIGWKWAKWRSKKKWKDTVSE